MSVYVVAQLLLVFSLICPKTTCLNDIFWVIGPEDQGCNNRTPCKTIEDYYKDNHSVFLTGNSSWILYRNKSLDHEVKFRVLITIQTERNLIFKGKSDHYSMFHIISTVLKVTASCSGKVIIKLAMVNYNFSDNGSCSILDSESVKHPMLIVPSSPYNGTMCNTSMKGVTFYETKGNKYCSLDRYKESSRCWIGFSEAKRDWLLSSECPIFFCNNQLSIGVIINKSNPLSSDQLCKDKSHRTGILCGKCKEGYSSAFGGHNCMNCTQLSFISIAYYPLVAFLGLAVIALLFLFNLTIVQGTINGISLYMNIMFLYSDIVREYANIPFYYVISALNQGSPFKTCFYHGMDEFAKCMLHFLFPFYLLILVVLIIIGGHKFNFRIFKVEFIAKRAVPVLATLMVLTYTGLVAIVIDALHPATILHLSDSSCEYISYRVWLYQPELEYFKGKHLVLGILAIVVTIFYLIPLTVVTLFGDLLRRNCIRSLWFSHFLDVFHGAYRWPLGFWLGLRLLMRLLFAVLKLSLQSNIFSFVFTLTGILFYLELHIIKPFHQRNLHIPTKYKAKKSWRSYFIRVISWLMKPENNDGLFLMNILFFCALTGLLSSGNNVILGILCGLSVSAAVIQMVIVICCHGWMYFPVPSFIKERWNNHRGTPRDRGNSHDYQQAVCTPVEFPFSHIHYLVAGLPEENESTDESDELSSNDKDSEVIEENQNDKLAETLLLPNED